MASRQSFICLSTPSLSHDENLVSTTDSIILPCSILLMCIPPGRLSRYSTVVLFLTSSPPPILHLLYLTLFGQRSTQRPCFDPVHRPSHRRKIGRAIFESWEPIRRSDCGATPDSKRGECNHEGRLDFRFWKRCTYICDAENADVTVMVQCMLVYISGQ